MVVFHFKAFTSECSFTPGHGSVIFRPASATKLCTGIFVTSVRKRKQKQEKVSELRQTWSKNSHKFLKYIFASRTGVPVLNSIKHHGILIPYSFALHILFLFVCMIFEKDGIAFRVKSNRCQPNNRRSDCQVSGSIEWKCGWLHTKAHTSEHHHSNSFDNELYYFAAHSYIFAHQLQLMKCAQRVHQVNMRQECCESHYHYQHLSNSQLADNKIKRIAVLLNASAVDTSKRGGICENGRRARHFSAHKIRLFQVV